MHKSTNYFIKKLVLSPISLIHPMLRHQKTRKETNTMFISFSCGCLARTRTRKCGTKNRCVTITLQGNPMSLERHAASNAVQNYCFFWNYNLFSNFFCTIILVLIVMLRRLAHAEAKLPLVSADL